MDAAPLISSWTFFYKNQIFLAEAGCSYFSPEIKAAIVLYLFLVYNILFLWILLLVSQEVKNAVKLSTMIGENFEIYWSQMAKNVLKLYTLRGTRTQNKGGPILIRMCKILNIQNVLLLQILCLLVRKMVEFDYFE